MKRNLDTGSSQNTPQHNTSMNANGSSCSKKSRRLMFSDSDDDEFTRAAGLSPMSDLATQDKITVTSSTDRIEASETDDELSKQLQNELEAYVKRERKIKPPRKLRLLRKKTSTNVGINVIGATSHRQAKNFDVSATTSRQTLETKPAMEEQDSNESGDRKLRVESRRRRKRGKKTKTVE